MAALEGRALLSTFFVATTGSDANSGLSLNAPFKTIQHGLDAASQPGDTIEVLGGTYHERLTFSHSGSASRGYITLENFRGQHVLISGRGAASHDVGFGNNMVQVIDQSYVKLIGFEIAYDSGVAVQDDAFGVRVQGSGTNVQILHNTVHDITGLLVRQGQDNVGLAGAGIHVYGSSLTTPYANVIIDGNTIFHCQPGDAETETLAVNGNVTGFQITNNVIHDDDNIGIDMIGGEGATFNLPDNTQNLPVARDGICSHNTVFNIHANYGGGFAGAIYVDGGKNITISDNVCHNNDMGLEVGAENKGYIASGVVVEDNVLYSNTQAGLVFGGFAPNVGRVQNCSFINNTVFKNDTLNTGNGQLWIQFASNNIVTNNIFVAGANNVLIAGDGAGNVANVLDHNLYFAPNAAKAQFNINAASFNGFAAYRKGTGEDAHSIFADPKFVNAAAFNFRLANASPAIDAGSTTAGQFDPVDFAGVTRGAPPDIGAFENISARRSTPAARSRAGSRRRTSTGRPATCRRTSVSTNLRRAGSAPVSPPVPGRPGAGLASIDGHAWITTAIDPQALDELLFGLAGRHRKLAFA
jgi:hypothetical protein